MKLIDENAKEALKNIDDSLSGLSKPELGYFNTHGHLPKDNVTLYHFSPKDLPSEKWAIVDYREPVPDRPNNQFELKPVQISPQPNEPSTTSQFVATLPVTGGSSYGGSSDMMSFDGVTEGIDVAAMGRYFESLKTDLLDKVSEEIDNVDDIVKVVNENWQGQARDRFLRQFAEQRRRIIDDLHSEYQDLNSRLLELQAFYFKADEVMMDM